MQTVKYRVNHPNLRPRRTRLEIPGWAGKPEPRADGSHEYAWHCIPFSEAAKAGIELFYPYDTELRVTHAGRRRCGSTAISVQPPEPPACSGRRSGASATEYYTYQILLDLKVEEGFAIKTEPHPRFYTDRSGTVPIAVPALLRHWWPMMYFMVFKSPDEGRTHIFRPGEPFMQVTIVPAEAEFELVPMSEEEAAEREMQGRRIYASRQHAGGGLAMDVGDQHSVRRNLPSHPRSREGDPQGFAPESKRAARRPP